MLLLLQKADLGPCQRAHSDAMKAEYEKQLAEGKPFRFERELFTFMEQIVRECDQKVSRAKWVNCAPRCGLPAVRVAVMLRRSCPVNAWNATSATTSK